VIEARTRFAPLIKTSSALIGAAPSSGRPCGPADRFLSAVTRRNRFAGLSLAQAPHNRRTPNEDAECAEFTIIQQKFNQFAEERRVFKLGRRYLTFGS